MTVCGKWDGMGWVFAADEDERNNILYLRCTKQTFVSLVGNQYHHDFWQICFSSHFFLIFFLFLLLSCRGAFLLFFHFHAAHTKCISRHCRKIVYFSLNSRAHVFGFYSRLFSALFVSIATVRWRVIGNVRHSRSHTQMEKWKHSKSIWFPILAFLFVCTESDTNDDVTTTDPRARYGYFTFHSIENRMELGMDIKKLLTNFVLSIGHRRLVTRSYTLRVNEATEKCKSGLWRPHLGVA